MMLSVNLGDSLKAWMNFKAVSQKELIELTGLDAKTIKNMRENDLCGHAKNYALICEALGITADELLHGPEVKMEN